jgi:uncharacterized protein involved in exopolysaccharide biosynthesis
MNLRQRLDDIHTELADARSNDKLMQDLIGDPTMDMPVVGGNVGLEGILVELKSKILNAEARLAQLRERYRDDAPEVVNATTTLETLRGLLKREVEARAKLSASRVKTLEAKLVPIEKELARTEAELGAMPSQEMNLSEMDREILLLKDRYAKLVSNSDQAQMTDQTTSNVSITVLSPAGPAKAGNTRDYVRLALAPAFSLVVGLGLAFFVDGLDPRVRTPLDVETSLDLPVLASVTERRKRVRNVAG